MEQPGYITIQSKSDRKEWFNIYLYNDISSDIVNSSLITQSVNYKLDDKDWQTFTVPYNTYMRRLVLYGYQVTLGDYQAELDPNNFAYTLSSNNFGRYAYSCSYDYEVYEGIIDFNPDESDIPTESDIPIEEIISPYSYIEYNYNQMINTPLTIEILEDGEIKWINQFGQYFKTIEYSKDNGNTWNQIISTTSGTSINVISGDKVLFRGNNQYYTTLGSNQAHVNYFNVTSNFNVYGNIMSLIDPINYNNLYILSAENTFHALFYSCSKLIYANNLILPATILSEGCYRFMFYNCRNMLLGPNLPAQNLVEQCYYKMFDGCISLINNPLNN